MYKSGGVLTGIIWMSGAMIKCWRKLCCIGKLESKQCYFSTASGNVVAKFMIQ